MGRFSRWLKKVTPLRISLVIAIVFCVGHYLIEGGTFSSGIFSKKGYIHQLDLNALDLKISNRKQEQWPEPKVVIAAIDEKSIEAYGLWPWRRSVIADFINVTTQGGAKVIGFDAVFSDEDRNASFQDIKRFLNSYKKNNLSPKSTGATALQQYVVQLQEENAQTLEAIASLKQKLSAPKRHQGKAKKEKEDPMLRSLRVNIGTALGKIANTTKRLGRNANATKNALDDLYQRSGKFQQEMQRVIATGSPDAALEKALSNSPQTVMGYFNFYNAEEIVGVDRADIAKAAKHLEKIAITAVFEETIQEVGTGEIVLVEPVQLDIKNLQITQIIAPRAPLPRFGAVSTAFGYFNAVNDPDGPMRRIRLLNRYEGKLYPALSIVCVAKFLNTDIRPINGSIKPGITLDGLLLGDHLVPTNMQGHLLINYYQDPVQYFPKYSISDIIDGTVAPEAYEGKIVLFGMTALGLYDMRPSPFNAQTPGVYVHAAAIQNMLDHRYLERYFGMALIEMLGFIAIAVLMGIALPRMPPWGGALLTLCLAVGIYLFDVTFIFPEGMWTMSVLPMLQSVFTYVGIALYGYLTVGHEKRKIRSAFQFYLTKSVVDEMLKEPGKLQLGGEKRVCTVLFSDIRGFTTISERLTPEQLSSLLNEYLTPMTNLVFKYDGTLDKYMGDAIMAIYGAPVAYEDHAARGCHSAIDMMESLAQLQRLWDERGVPVLDIGIGLNTGPMSVGNMGSEVRFDYTVMGDNVNLGSRLEGINKQYGTNIIISENTRRAAGDAIYVRELDSVRVKGKHEPVVIFELLGKNQPSGDAKNFIEEFESGIRLYKAQNWDGAQAAFNRVRSELKPKDFASSIYIERCEAMRANPPEDGWDGVFTMTTK